MLPGFRQFFKELYGLGVNIDLAMCKANAIADFVNNVKKNPDSINILLTDSDGPYSADLLRSVRQHDHWNTTIAAAVSDEHIHFMVQVMESWFLADRDTLRDFYGPRLSENRLPRNPNVEQIPKADVESGLRAATAGTSKGRYHKTKHAPTLLANIAPSAVKNAAPNCNRLFDYLQSLADQPN